MRRLTLRLALLGLMLIAGHAHAQTDRFPQKAVRIIVPFTAGQGSDVIARLMGERLSQIWGQPVVVDNKPGANGSIAVDLVVRSPADGHTLLLTSNSPLVISPSIYRKLPYDPQKDLSPVAFVGYADIILVANPKLQARNMKELLAALKADGKASFASPGTGSTSHLTMEIFRKANGLDMVHVPYKGSGPALTDIAGGQVLMMADATPSAAPLIRAGAIRALAMTGPRRSSLLPDIPTAAEFGLNELPAGGWYGVLAPASTPAAVVAKIHADVLSVIARPEIQERMKAQGIEPPPAMPIAQFADFIRTESTYWETTTRRLGLYRQE
ncbi:MAG: tripartite tricarboxylate transporter substrate binding protein [Polaromonas sp.]|nr:tripartite tricarboxylate transporter substrate binding protein [Polaromonas sp.]